MSPEEAKDYYLGLVEEATHQGWRPYNPPPVVRSHEGVRVVRDDLIVGTKTRAGDILAHALKADTLVYCQPRVGLAGVSLCDVAEHHNKKLILFMPSCKKISPHQACCIERGAQVKFRRIAAMPNLNLWANEYARQTGACFIPLGLKHQYATAGIVHAASMIKEPEEVYVATSTGVLTRALQIAWPNAKFISVAVARNMKAGELGRAEVISHPYPFTKPIKLEEAPPFPAIATYDAKVWRYVPKNSGKDVLMWNVGPEPELHDPSIIEKTDSYREWKEIR